MMQKTTTATYEDNALNMTNQKNTRAKIILNDERGLLLLKIRDEETISALTTSVKYYIGHADQSNKARKQKAYGRERKMKLLLFSDGMIVPPNPKKVTKKLLKLISECSRVIGYKIIYISIYLQ